jgi:3-isopropylmalate/(R)-2-methylmalate dehydratase large subunit
MANMAVEGGAKNGIFTPDATTREYVQVRTIREPVFLSSDSDAEYEKTIRIDVAQVEPQVAFPHSPDNVRPVSEAREIALDQVFIGSCTNGRMSDLQKAADVLKGRTVARDTRLIVLPGSREIYKRCIQEGIIEIFLDAGATVGPPSCGPCLGGHLGILAKNEKALGTSNRNFVGRMGHPESQVYLAGPAVAAASSVLGRIGSPAEL